MAGLSDGFESFLVPSEQQIREAITEGLVVLDTNVLLEAYRFAPTARRQLLDVLINLGDRLWIPHQVALEFHKNRLSVIASFDDSYNEALKAVDEFRLTVEEVLGQRAAELANRVSLPERERKSLLTPIRDALDRTQEHLNQMRKRHGLAPASIMDDSILTALRKVLDGKVGESPPSEQRDEMIKEAARRAAAKVPPGYKDFATKSDGSGDYLVWAQTLEEAARRKLPLLFVTRDAKEDWFMRIRGKTICGRSELIAEAQQVAGVRAIIMQTHTLLFHARSFLQPEISDETIRQAAHAAENGGSRGSKSRVVIRADIFPQMVEHLESEIQHALAYHQDVVAFRREVRQAQEEATFDTEADTESVTRHVQLSEARLDDAEDRLRRARRNLAILRGGKTVGRDIVINWSGPPQPWTFKALADKLGRSAS
ncbi:PIN-like domain-containing protein [Micromonospora sp. NPDC005367]|uniref:PIN domain-containing protein n=1 Tax=Micromonospora sp. NPDC005367 TaxID=3155590 RepID=UPI00339E1613